MKLIFDKPTLSILKYPFGFNKKRIRTKKLKGSFKDSKVNKSYRSKDW